MLVCSAIVNSKLGKVMVAIRDAESRTRFLGYRVDNVKLFAFVVSAVIAGIAGALYVPQVGIINPSEFSPANSIEVVIWTAVGGRGTCSGRSSARLLVNAGKSYFTGALARFLALRARRPVHAGHAVPAQGHRRPAHRPQTPFARNDTAAQRQHRSPKNRRGGTPLVDRRLTPGGGVTP